MCISVTHWAQWLRAQLSDIAQKKKKHVLLLVAVRRQNQWQQSGQYSPSAKKKWHSSQSARFYRSTRTGQSDWPALNLNSLGNTQFFTKALTERLRQSQMRENFPFNQTSEAKAVKERVLIITRQNSHSFADNFLTSGPCFCKRGCCSSDERRGEGQRGSKGVCSQNSECGLSSELVSTLTPSIETKSQKHPISK